MSIEVASMEDAYLRIYHRLAAEDWIFITGDSNGIIRFEYAVYPPGTDKNADFELVMAGRRYFYIGKKTPELRKALELAGSENDGTWDSLYGLSVQDLGNGKVDMQTAHFKDVEEKEILLEDIVKNLVDLLGAVAR